MPIQISGIALPERRLTAILAADIAGYSRLMAVDEAATVHDLKAHQAVVLPMVGSFGGTIIDTAGDGILAAFPSAVRAVECAIAIQQTMSERNRDVSDDRRMLFRIGVNLGDVIGEGTASSATASMSLPGWRPWPSRAVSASPVLLRRGPGQGRGGLEDLGDHSVKNLSQPVRAYRVIADGG